MLAENCVVRAIAWLTVTACAAPMGSSDGVMMRFWLAICCWVLSSNACWRVIDSTPSW